MPSNIKKKTKASSILLTEAAPTTTNLPQLHSEPFLQRLVIVVSAPKCGVNSSYRIFIKNELTAL